MTRTTLYYLGRNAGWSLALRYATGTKTDRRGVRAKLGRLAPSYSQFALGVWDGFGDFAEQRSESIKAGLAPRTVNPHRLVNLLGRVG